MINPIKRTSKMFKVFTNSFRRYNNSKYSMLFLLSSTLFHISDDCLLLNWNKHYRFLPKLPCSRTFVYHNIYESLGISSGILNGFHLFSFSGQFGKINFYWNLSNIAKFLQEKYFSLMLSFSHVKFHWKIITSKQLQRFYLPLRCLTNFSLKI